ncbi:hypothetical protein SEA_CLEARASMUD_77 [Microbacterium phage ClearAsMud]|uniref:Uncharacterized protein n=2 Tax=Quhwahvirus TaxID=2733202 RepID=A0A899IR06_9CAUD|nr:hypothetical protein QDA07_gp77 [Microbacterium phage ClearAsMud]YP_010751728.1 hypothetical protein QDA08_gp74 [Microbacterium phage NoodlelyBoi]QNL30287.1 hypothetical protein SEA_CLEARASMUD_77 [Microbacterium phage ClearAsMud]QSM01268.1 hypothetical protein SEA_NOODLELYBOI_74 [Microbacterium phage NoodlelyBoi]
MTERDIRAPGANPATPGHTRIGVFENVGSFGEQKPLTAASLHEAVGAMLAAAPDASWVLVSATTTRLEFESLTTELPNGVPL